MSPREVLLRHSSRELSEWIQWHLLRVEREEEARKRHQPRGASESRHDSVPKPTFGQ